uniref:Uncharacterized protein n=1 Tax=Heterorhabditis bacteriophora TaxID=37862 RepID=A0A1I7WTL9_HETBA
MTFVIYIIASILHHHHALCQIFLHDIIFTYMSRKLGNVFRSNQFKIKY